MVSTEQLNVLKGVSIVDFLASRGILPVSQQGGQLLYHSPLRNDQTASSFWVHPAKNTFIDFVVAEHKGDVIRLVQLLDSCDFLTAVQTLECWKKLTGTPSFFLSGQNTSNSMAAKKKDIVKAVKLLASKPLMHYVESRGISYPIARMYLREVYYHHQQKPLFSIGFANDKEGFAIRRNPWTDQGGINHEPKMPKFNLGPAWYTTIEGKQAGIVNVFEGVFDFLSALEYYQQPTPANTTIVLNSTKNIESALPVLQSFSRINAYVDRDTAGQATLERLRDHSIQVVDRSNIYAGYKDFNEYWQAYTVKTTR
ncbi:toprim domain-containing protein [Spirosoma migulaei]